MDAIRVSCGALIRLMVDGRFALIGSRTTFRLTGQRRLSPFGGGIETTERGQTDLVNQFDVDPATFEGGYDLRFRLACKHIDRFRIWFNEGSELELDPAGREFREETGPDEHNLLLPALATQARFVLMHQSEYVLPSTRRGQEGVMTHCFHRFYEADVPEELRQELLRAAQRGTNLLELVTADEIAARKSARGSDIAELCQFLV